MNWNFYRYRTNWHKHPWISPILCWIGRHDYEFVYIKGITVKLECFYCGQRKQVQAQIERRDR
jgi:hypothetical protein